MNYFVASEIGCFLGFSTNFLPQELHLNLGFPLPKLPFLTMSLEEQFGQFIVKSLRDFRSVYFIIISLEFQDYPKNHSSLYRRVSKNSFLISGDFYPIGIASVSSVQAPRSGARQHPCECWNPISRWKAGYSFSRGWQSQRLLTWKRQKLSGNGIRSTARGAAKYHPVFRITSTDWSKRVIQSAP